jgi:superfamily II DNA or RNA helicase
LNVLICSTIADMGLDLPILEALVLAGGGKSSTRHLQRIGRVVRTNLDKKSALVMDFDDSHVSTWLGKHEQERRKIEHAEWADCAIWI